MRVGYGYIEESTVGRGPAGDQLALATSGGISEHPYLFSGFLARPRLSASLLLSVSKVAGTRFYVPASMIAKAVRLADPVVTADSEQLRFESFSACTGVYARADLLSGSIDDGFIRSGTTNVDFNPPMQDALSLVRDADAAHLAVGNDEVTLATMRGSVTERKVKLPDRWLRGFAEVQVAQAAMALQFDLGSVGAKRLLSTLARTGRRGDWWALPGGGTATLTSEARPWATRIAGLERLHLLATHARHARGLRVWATPDTDQPATAWELDLPDSRFTLVLSPDVSRGFSGEGNVLRDLSDQVAVRTAEQLRPLITGAGSIDVGSLAATAEIDLRSAQRALNVLAASGAAGYELASESYFHRELPFDADALALLHPRLQGAKALGRGAVVFLAREQASTVAAVTGVHDTYVVRRGPTGTSCTCPWYESHGESRGPCKHVLAVDLALAGEPS